MRTTIISCQSMDTALRRVRLWTTTVCAMLGLALAGFAAADEAADLVWVSKSDRTLHLLNDYRIIRSYPVALGKQPRGHKQTAGDSRTPEGLYLIDWRNPSSRFYLSLHVSYPGVNDRHRAAHLGVRAGGDIMIHGHPETNERGTAGTDPDWTDGCIALSNRDMGEVWRMIADNTPILIDP